MSVLGALMPPAYDLILLDQSRFQIKTVQVKDAADAWRLGRDLYPDVIRGVVCQDASAARIVKPR